MTIREFYQPSKISVLLFIVLFAIIFFIPYLKAEPALGSPDIITPGRYPLIYIFLMSLVVIMDFLSGSFILGDFLLFAAFLLFFILLYTLTCGAAYWMAKRQGAGSGKATRADSTESADREAYHESSSYVLDLEDEDRSD